MKYKTRSESLAHLKELGAEDVGKLAESKLSEEQIRKEISCVPMSEEWKEHQKNSWWSSHYEGHDEKALERKKEYLPLIEKLLSIGGEEVCLPPHEEDFEKIMERGQLWSGKHSVTMKKGKPSQCHRNSCDLWYTNQDKTLIATGYALSEDGMWRQHSWVVHLKPRAVNIVETTVKREAYFGFVMTADECFAFDEANL